MKQKRILFGFYKGLGDFISDSFIIEHFYNNNFTISIAVAKWLEELAKYMFPNANILSYQNGSDLAKFSYNYKYIFLTPNYLHPVNINYKSIPLYLLKYRLVKKRTDKNSLIIKPSYWELFNYYFNLKKTSLNKHFYYMSYDLIKRYFPEVPDRRINTNAQHEKVLINRIFIFPFSGFKPKDYPVQNYYKIAKTLKEKYKLKDITFFVVPKDREKLKNIEEEFQVRTKSLVELATTFKKTDLVICSDSGPGHLATKFGANTIILYSTTNPEKYKPTGSGKIVTIKASDNNINNIETEEILKSIEENFCLG